MPPWPKVASASAEGLLAAMRCLYTFFLLASICQAQMELKALRGTVLEYNVDGQNFRIRATDRKEYRLRWNVASKLSDKKRTANFSGIENRGQDVSFLLGYGWREQLESKKISVQRGYIYNTQGAKKARLPNAESAVITGILRPNGDDSGTLLVNGQEFAVSLEPQAVLVATSPTIAAAIFRITDDVRIWASRLDGEFFVHQMEFLSGDWPAVKKAPPRPKQNVSAGLPGHDTPREINHAPATATGNGFTRTISKELGALPQAANVTRRPVRNNNNNRHNNNRNNNNRNNNRNRNNDNR
ncbi:MAG: hypothetical protein ACI8W8_003200 [Rhodothermales bacterium]|jgi:hypothetical protein